MMRRFAVLCTFFVLGAMEEAEFPPDIDALREKRTGIGELRNGKITEVPMPGSEPAKEAPKSGKIEDYDPDSPLGKMAQEKPESEMTEEEKKEAEKKKKEAAEKRK